MGDSNGRTKISFRVRAKVNNPLMYGAHSNSSPLDLPPSQKVSAKPPGLTSVREASVSKPYRDTGNTPTAHGSDHRASRDRDDHIIRDRRSPDYSRSRSSRDDNGDRRYPDDRDDRHAPPVGRDNRKDYPHGRDREYERRHSDRYRERYSREDEYDMRREDEFDNYARRERSYSDRSYRRRSRSRSRSPRPRSRSPRPRSRSPRPRSRSPRPRSRSPRRRAARRSPERRRASPRREDEYGRRKSDATHDKKKVQSPHKPPPLERSKPASSKRRRSRSPSRTTSRTASEDLPAQPSSDSTAKPPPPRDPPPNQPKPPPLEPSRPPPPDSAPPAPPPPPKPTVQQAPQVEQTWGEGSVDQYEIMKQIGEGTYGQVYKAKCKKTGQLVALKKVRMDNEKEGFPITALREIKILRQLNHDSIVCLQDIVTDTDATAALRYKSAVFMVFEYMDHDLTGLLDGGNLQLNVDQIRVMMRQLLEGLQYCHKKGFLHRDIKGSNLLVNNKGQLKLADFGLARRWHEGDKRAYTNKVITLWYRPPELLLGSNVYGAEVDLWSAGCILGQLFNRKPIIRGDTELSQLDAIFRLCGSPTHENWPSASDCPNYHTVRAKNTTTHPRQLKSKYREIIPHEPLDLLDKLLTLDPAKRGDTTDALNHPYFRVKIHAPIELPTSQDCHEMWSKRQRKRLSSSQHAPHAPQHAQQQPTRIPQHPYQQQHQQHPHPHPLHPIPMGGPPHFAVPRAGLLIHPPPNNMHPPPHHNTHPPPSQHAGLGPPPPLNGMGYPPPPPPPRSHHHPAAK